MLICFSSEKTKEVVEINAISSPAHVWLLRQSTGDLLLQVLCESWYMTMLTACKSKGSTFVKHIISGATLQYEASFCSIEAASKAWSWQKSQVFQVNLITRCLWAAQNIQLHSVRLNNNNNNNNNNKQHLYHAYRSKDSSDTEALE